MIRGGSRAVYRKLFVSYIKKTYYCKRLQKGKLQEDKIQDGKMQEDEIQEGKVQED